MGADDSAFDRNTPARRSNADYDWRLFDSEAYFQHYYGAPHQDDDRVIQCAVAALKLAPPVGAELDVVDVGTGPNLIPLFCALPRARTSTVWEYSESNIAWLKAEFAREKMRSQWQHFWGVTRTAYGADYRLPEDPTPTLRTKCILRQGSIFDMPQRSWDVATMFFCAESITGRQDEFDAACAAFANSVRRGGALLAAFLVRSAGYRVADHEFPILNVSVNSVQRVFAHHADVLTVEKIGIVEREIRSGYSGFVFLTGHAR